MIAFATYKYHRVYPDNEGIYKTACGAKIQVRAIIPSRTEAKLDEICMNCWRNVKLVISG